MVSFKGTRKSKDRNQTLSEKVLKKLYFTNLQILLLFKDSAVTMFWNVCRFFCPKASLYTQLHLLTVQMWDNVSQTLQNAKNCMDL